MFCYVNVEYNVTFSQPACNWLPEEDWAKGEGIHIFDEECVCESMVCFVCITVISAPYTENVR